MYIHPIDEHTISSFLLGFETGTKGKCCFRELLREKIENKYKIKYASRGLTEQIKKLAKKRNNTWVMTFRKIAMEILTSDGDNLSSKIKKFLKYDVDGQAEIYKRHGYESPNRSWIDHWLTFTFLKYAWAKEMWTVDEWKAIKQIDKRTQTEKA
jgi:superfamily I DNA/RNA helicase